MLKVNPTTRFKKDLKKAGKQGRNPSKLKAIIDLLASGEDLPEKCRDHVLIGNYVGHRECHIQPDWLLIYKIDGEYLILVRTGSHNVLF